MDRPFKNYRDEVLAWWVKHLDGGCAMCPTETSPEVAAQVRAEFARRNPNAKPRPERERSVRD